MLEKNNWSLLKILIRFEGYSWIANSSETNNKFTKGIETFEEDTNSAIFRLNEISGSIAIARKNPINNVEVSKIEYGNETISKMLQDRTIVKSNKANRTTFLKSWMVDLRTR